MTVTVLVLGPIIIGLILYALPKGADALARGIGVAVAGLTFLLIAIKPDAPDASLPWLSRPFTASFHLGYGPISFWIVLLLAAITFSALVALRIPRTREFTAQMLILQGSMTGVFLAKDMLLFALFWDLMLIPVFLLMLGWGVPSRSTPSHGTAAWRYLIYNVAGGLTLLLATAGFGVVNGSTDVIGSHLATTVGDVWGPWIFAGFAFAFLIKTPVWPLHTWMPDTYTELPPPVVAVVSAVQSKAGLYGFIAIGLPFLNEEMHAAAPLMFVLGLVALLYGAFIAFVEDDTKRVMAYSSLSHLGLILIAIFSFNPIALAGAAVYIVAHGLFSASSFLTLGYIEEREETRSLAHLGGLAAENPRMSGALMISALAALGLPGLAGFAGEILILSGVYAAGFWWAALIALIPIVIAAGYMLRLFQGIMHGPKRADLPERHDLTWNEGFALAPLVVGLVLLGINPHAVAAFAFEGAKVALGIR
ncbi:MAG TPA: NADH-quinone oxidoreductase subunit M [Candidatus Lustribacter sp.]|jgi:NADH-quinone oxidoreductase subunit M|nr:NADH-quinone oxidoreductase subunit M [Candidatus Lustribacter sp.]